MFGCSAKIEELRRVHIQEIKQLKTENERLEERIRELEEPTYIEDTKREEFLATLLESYASGNKFLKKE